MPTFSTSASGSRNEVLRVIWSFRNWVRKRFAHSSSLRNTKARALLSLVGTKKAGLRRQFLGMSEGWMPYPTNLQIPVPRQPIWGDPNTTSQGNISAVLSCAKSVPQDFSDKTTVRLGGISVFVWIKYSIVCRVQKLFCAFDRTKVRRYAALR